MLTSTQNGSLAASATALRGKIRPNSPRRYSIEYEPGEVVPFVGTEPYQKTVTWQRLKELQPHFHPIPSAVESQHLVPPEHYGALRAAINSGLHRFVNRQVLYESMLPLMQAAAADRTITAWVAYNDDCALLCFEFLGRQGIEVPRQVSLVGFDNCAEACAQGLTSYDFDGARIVREALGFALHPARTGFRRPKVHYREVEGFVCERFTCTRAPNTIRG
jgi:hypothetical protein